MKHKIEHSITVEGVVRLVGRAELRSALGLKDTAISNAIAGNEFPASWRERVDELVEARGLGVLGREYLLLFKMRRPEISSGVVQ